MSHSIAVISCVHGNLAALEAVLDDVRSEHVDRVYCLGDLVGYGPYPREVIRTIERAGIETVLGCWDQGIGADQGHCGCTFESEEEARLGKIAFEWTRDRLTKKDRSFLANLPFGLSLSETPAGRIAFVHGSPRSSSEYLTESTHELVLLERAAGAGCDVLVCGHTHVPYVRKVEGALRVTSVADAEHPVGAARRAGREIELRPKWIVNAGSVGEPRHGRPSSTYVILDTDLSRIRIREVPYDVAATVAALRRRRLPEEFSARLSRGSEMVRKTKEIVCVC